MTMRLSASSFAGTARTLVAVGSSSEACMFLAIAFAAPRRGETVSAESPSFDFAGVVEPAAGLASPFGSPCGCACSCGRSCRGLAVSCFGRPPGGLLRRVLLRGGAAVAGGGVRGAPTMPRSSPRRPCPTRWTPLPDVRLAPEDADPEADPLPEPPPEPPVDEPDPLPATLVPSSGA